jgi:hypothetical protein
LATVFGAYKDTIEHVTIADDYKPIVGAYAAQHANLGHGILSRRIFHEVTETPDRSILLSSWARKKWPGRSGKVSISLMAEPHKIDALNLCSGLLVICHGK